MAILSMGISSYSDSDFNQYLMNQMQAQYQSQQAIQNYATIGGFPKQNEKKGFLNDLREEISEWHGDVLCK